METMETGEMTNYLLDVYEKELLAVNINKDTYIIRTLRNYYDGAEIYEAQRLRYQAFCQKLGWPLKTKNGRECDEYDIFAVHFAAFTLEGLVGYVRIIQSFPLGLMLENEFRDTLGEQELQLDKEHSVEISRLCVRTGVFNPRRIIEGLYKAMYQWSKINDKRYWYIVVEGQYLKILERQCLPFKQIGPGYEYEKGILSVPAVLNQKELEKTLAIKRPGFLKWLKESDLVWEEIPEFEMNRVFS